MAIAKQAFYEGAALHQLIRSNGVRSLQYDDPFFVLNGRVLAYLKYSTRVRSPWGFTFTADEQILLNERAAERKIAIGLICAGDGIATVSYEDYLSIAAPRKSAIHVACYRKHWEHYEVSGPDGVVARKIAPSDWQRLLS
ncbi:MAG: hypothetical protein WD823_02540 [Sulfuricaulis sp.]|uniref:hypothetical protein n=1 Tax=Sulfuricaulis sp. TaxID=2003553 RepID=UPI0034A3A775